MLIQTNLEFIGVCLARSEHAVMLVGWLVLFYTQGATGVAGALEPPVGHGGVLALR